MISPASAHRKRLPLGLVALLIFVFLWGLHYKLSLYHSHNAKQGHTEFPPAKLLSDAEYPSSLRTVVSFLLKSQLKVTVMPAASPVFSTGPVRSGYYALLKVHAARTPAPPAYRQFLPRPPPMS
jgi:hypothetical protein